MKPSSESESLEVLLEGLKGQRPLERPVTLDKLARRAVDAGRLRELHDAQPAGLAFNLPPATL